MCYCNCPYEITGGGDKAGNCRKGGFNGNPPEDAACYDPCDHCKHGDECVEEECEHWQG